MRFQKWMLSLTETLRIICQNEITQKSDFASTGGERHWEWYMITWIGGFFMNGCKFDWLPQTMLETSASPFIGKWFSLRHLKLIFTWIIWYTHITLIRQLSVKMKWRRSKSRICSYGIAFDAGIDRMWSIFRLCSRHTPVNRIVYSKWQVHGRFKA